MKLTFVYQPADDLAAAVEFHRDVLGFEEAWREGDDTVAFRLPGTEVLLMISTDVYPAGLMYEVDDLDAWAASHPQAVVAVEKYAIPGGSMTGFAGPGGAVFYVFDQPDV